MQLPTIPKIGRLSRKHKITVAGAAAAAAVVLTVTGLQATGGTAVASGDPTGFSVSTGDKVKSLDAKTGMASQKAIADEAAAQKKATADAATKNKAATDTVAKKKAEATAPAKKATAPTTAKKKAVADAAKRAHAANRSTHRAAIAHKPAPKPAPKPVRKAVPKPTQKAVQKAAPAPVKKTTAAPVAAKTYANNLDGWIRESLDVMHDHNIPGSYNGIYRNIMRESSGNPNAINLWDINAQNGIPSKGLLQVIDPTFQAYHVPGTSWNIYDPVANITAACNYAADKYGSMDNVNSAY